MDIKNFLKTSFVFLLLKIHIAAVQNILELLHAAKYFKAAIYGGSFA
jgi:hypothetical protein